MQRYCTLSSCLTMHAGRCRLCTCAVQASLEGERAGTKTKLRTSLAYASPEDAQAARSGKEIVASAASAVFVLGVLAYEAVTQGPAQAGMPDFMIQDCARNARKYPWEAIEHGHAWCDSRLRRLIAPCLARNAAARPAAAQVATAAASTAARLRCSGNAAAQDVSSSASAGQAAGGEGAGHVRLGTSTDAHASSSALKALQRARSGARARLDVSSAL